MQLEEPRFVHQVLRGCHPSPVRLPCASDVTESRCQQAAGGSRRRVESAQVQTVRGTSEPNSEEQPGRVTRCGGMQVFLFIHPFN